LRKNFIFNPLIIRGFSVNFFLKTYMIPNIMWFFFQNYWENFQIWLMNMK